MAMMRLITASLVLLIALGANAALYLRQPASPAPPTGHVTLTLGTTTLDVPRRLLREPEATRPGAVERVELVAAIADFAPLPSPSPLNPEDKLPDAITIIITAQTAGAAEPFQALYARFLSGETRPMQGGLVLRRFRTGTPFEDRDLFIGAGSRLFVALCAKDAEKTGEPCLATLRQNGLELQLRFGAKYLSSWRRITQEAMRLVEQMRQQG